MSIRQHRAGKVRKGHGDLVRTSQRHADTRRKVRRRLREQEQSDALDEWAEDYEGDTIWTD